MASASNAKKKYCQKFWTENANVGRVSCQRHKAYMISNDPVVRRHGIAYRCETIGAGQGIQSLLLLVYKTLAIFQNRGKFFFLDSHSLFVEVDVPALLNEGTDCNEIVSHINAFLQGIELCEFLIELRGFGIGIMKRG